MHAKKRILNKKGKILRKRKISKRKEMSKLLKNNENDAIHSKGLTAEANGMHC
jgi:hypothetical protein